MATKTEWADYCFDPWELPCPRRIVAPESQWALPFVWQKKAASDGVRRRVLVGSEADPFEDWKASMRDNGHQIIRDAEGWYSPLLERRTLFMDDVRRRLFDLIDATPNLDWLLLTKRPENIDRLLAQYAEQIDTYAAEAFSKVWGRRVWLGTSVENREALARIDHLRKVPATVRFLSVEPLLEDLGTIDLTGIHWVIVGGESGPNARPMHPDWVRSIRDQCQAAGVPFFFKQWGEWVPGWPGVKKSGGLCGRSIHFESINLLADGSRFDSNSTTTFSRPDRCCSLYRVGKKAAGRLLDGRTWDEMPTTAGKAGG